MDQNTSDPWRVDNLLMCAGLQLISVSICGSIIALLRLPSSSGPLVSFLGVVGLTGILSIITSRRPPFACAALAISVITFLCWFLIMLTWSILE